MNKKCWDSVHKIFFIHYVHKSAVKNARKKSGVQVIISEEIGGA